MDIDGQKNGENQACDPKNIESQFFQEVWHWAPKCIPSDPDEEVDKKTLAGNGKEEEEKQRPLPVTIDLMTKDESRVEHQNNSNWQVQEINPTTTH